MNKSTVQAGASTMATCPFCGIEFRAERKGRNRDGSPRYQRYCSADCYNSHQNRHPLVTSICTGCGVEFQARRHYTMYCSRECAFEHKQKRCKACDKPMRGAPQDICSECKQKSLGYYYRTCIVCESPFIAKSKQSGICSRECRNSYQRKRYRETFVSVRETNIAIAKSCDWCGCEYTTNFNASRRKYCSQRCSQSAARSTERAKARLVRARNRRDQRLLSSGRVERFSYFDVAKRDGWNCHICGKKINNKLRWPDRAAPTFDHLVPVSLGGQHVMANVRLAHFICNAERREVGAAQLVLGI
jgi:hypothetical protein